MRKLYLLIISAACCTITLKAQAQNNGTDDAFAQLIRSNAADATKLIGAYSEPFFRGFGTGLASGWNNTAKTKKLLHFDLRILAANVALVPEADKSFDVRALGLSNNIKLASNSPTPYAPTVGGSKNGQTPLMEVTYNDNTKSTFSMPTGKVPVIPTPNIQLTIGVAKNTDVTIRTIPTINLPSDAGSVGMIGFGVKHNLIQDFAKGIPKPFDLAVAVNYNRIKYKINLDVKPDAGTTNAGGGSTDFSNQRIEATFSGLNLQAILSKKLAVFTPFVAINYQSAKSDLGALGNYPIKATATTYTTVIDPVHINETSLSGIRADVGFQLDMGFLKFYASYDIGKYQSVNGGIGIGI